MKKTKGFTLIELMVTIAILAVVVGIAAPNMGMFITRQKVSSQSSELATTLAAARAEAARTNQDIVVIPAADNTNGWASGWCFGPTAIDNCSHAAVIKIFGNIDADQVEISSPYRQSSNRLTFRRDGTLLNSIGAQAFKVTSSKLKSSSTDARCIQLNKLGKTNINKVAPNANC
ncbi:pilus assembly FimT family protein [Atopomonas hussainii]|uniref:pilus assembly FimT family protein n=1 Tax=Atopomonas hussainii TaxID=1429083 RepID=UPI0009002DE7|nr:GspH/FimT family pseudopilin [Atopomonas hussainii]